MKYFVFLLMVLALTATMFSQVPNKISYQGLLTTSAGTLVQNGSYNLKFDFYNLPSAGTLRHTETHTAVPVERGTFSVNLGPLPAIFSESLYVEVTALSGPGISGPLTFSPRSELTSAPYSLAPWVPSGNNIYYNGGNVGIGTASPIRTLEVNGDILAASTNPSISVRYSGGSQRDLGLYWDIVNDRASIYSAIPEGSYKPISFKATGYYFETGNVGIGTTTPVTKTDVNGTIRTTGITAPVTSGAGLELYYSSDAGSILAFDRSATLPKDLYLGSRNTYFQTKTFGAGVGDMLINSDGNVGIGTTSPLGKLDVNASLGTLPLRLTQNANHSYTPSMITMHDADGEVGTIGVVSASGALGMIGLNSLSLSAGTGYGALGVHINTSGNVGIGTTTPDAKLEVAGQIKITGGNPGTDKVLTSDSAGTASWAPPAGAVNCIVCNQTGVITGAPGGYTFNFTAPDCGGSLPDSTYIGVGVQFEICGGFITWRVNQAPNPGVTIYSANGPCDGYDFTVVYLKRQ